LLTFSGDANGAISTLDTYMRLAPLYPELALYFLAEARFSLGQFDEAVLANPRCVLPATPPELSVVVTDSAAPGGLASFMFVLKQRQRHSASRFPTLPMRACPPSFTWTCSIRVNCWPRYASVEELPFASHTP
jgi:hypothetical protein